MAMPGDHRVLKFQLFIDMRGPSSLYKGAPACSSALGMMKVHARSAVLCAGRAGEGPEEELDPRAQ